MKTMDQNEGNDSKQEIGKKTKFWETMGFYHLLFRSNLFTQFSDPLNTNTDMKGVTVFVLASAFWLSFF